MTRTGKIVMATHGTLGDLHPLMALASGPLGAPAWPPIICSHDNFQPKVESIGIPFQSFGPGYQTYRDDLKISQDELVRRMSRDHAYMLKLLVAPYLASAVQDLMPLVRDADMVVGSRYAYGAHIAAQLCGKPYTALALQPAVMLSAYDPPKLKDAFFNTAPRGAIGRTHNRVIKLIGTGLLASGPGPVSRIYQSFGLEPQDRIDGIVADQQTLALYSPLIGKLQPDFPPRTQIVGFPFFDSESGASARLAPALETFLSSGTPPLVFSLGSVAVFDSIAFYRDAIQACKELGQRCVILAGDSPLLTENFGPDVFITPYAPHSLLFPRALAVVHHGGIGSTAQGLRAGRPQLITPGFADQFDNAHPPGTSSALCRSARFRPMESVGSGVLAETGLLADPSHGAAGHGSRADHRQRRRRRARGRHRCGLARSIVANRGRGSRNLLDAVKCWAVH